MEVVGAADRCAQYPSPRDGEGILALALASEDKPETRFNSGDWGTPIGRGLVGLGGPPC